MNYLIVGLGNPGKEYAGTRHNAGFIAVSRLAEKSGASKTKTRILAQTWSAKSGRDAVYLLEPHTFMNLSGSAVAAFAKLKKIPHKNIVVIHDELDLPFGEVRLSVGSGPAGHNGARSVIETLGTKDFARVRIGIGPRPENVPADKFVLARFSAEEKKALPDISEEAIASALAYLKIGQLNEGVSG